jgi:ATP-dependent DNA helicase PIF1
VLLLRVGARVMFLDNSLFDRGICSGTTGVVTEVDDDAVRIAFSCDGAINDTIVRRVTHYFTLNGARAQRTQFPLQNAFALTIHKTQGSTLPHITVPLDEQMFANGQAYVALSRVPAWNRLAISCLSRDAFRCDPAVMAEYARLETVYAHGIKN